MVAKSKRTIFLDGRPFSRRYQIENVLAAAASLHQPWRILECVCSDETANAGLSGSTVSGIHPAGNRDYQLYLEVKARFEAITHPQDRDRHRPPIGDLLCNRHSAALRVTEFRVVPRYSAYTIENLSAAIISAGHNYDQQSFSSRPGVDLFDFALAQAPEKSADCTRHDYQRPCPPDSRLRPRRSTPMPTRRSGFSTKASTSARPIPTTSATSASTRRGAEIWALNSFPSGSNRKPIRATSRATPSI